jgi:hypothetical protein
MPILELPPGKVLHVSGWGKKTPSGNFTLHFREEGEGSVWLNHTWNEGYYKFIPTQLAITVRNGMISTGGRFVGGGFGLQGAALGMLEAGVLNALMTRNQHYGMLTLTAYPPGLTPRVVVLGYKGKTDSDIVKAVAAAREQFMDYWTNQLLTLLEAAEDDVKDATRSAIELMTKRGWFSDQQLRLMAPELQPRKMIEITPFELPRSTAENQSSSASDTVTQLQKLADLHASGALTDDEFRTAKARIIGF